ncbi:uncharacterized protein LTR77_009259 [Saxophila tyrrhenica]|uniref:Uncharacterized protein n=1 Tax=Saxophila tyrrhenica TaxID=1690608 RepID=A0AAV9NYX8_9PEZI|nr:hypothetical protein LTR77_009259 [Saxophila tyrrhenica]
MEKATEETAMGNRTSHIAAEIQDHASFQAITMRSNEQGIGNSSGHIGARSQAEESQAVADGGQEAEDRSKTPPAQALQPREACEGSTAGEEVAVARLDALESRAEADRQAAARSQQLVREEQDRRKMPPPPQVPKRKRDRHAITADGDVLVALTSRLKRRKEAEQQYGVRRGHLSNLATSIVTAWSAPFVLSVDRVEDVFDMPLKRGLQCACTVRRPRAAMPLFLLDTAINSTRKRAGQSKVEISREKFDPSIPLIRQLEMQLGLLRRFRFSAYAHMEMDWPKQSYLVQDYFKQLAEEERLSFLKTCVNAGDHDRLQKKPDDPFSNELCTCGSWEANVAAYQQAVDQMERYQVQASLKRSSTMRREGTESPPVIIQDCTCGSVRTERRTPRKAVALWMVAAALFHVRGVDAFVLDTGYPSAIDLDPEYDNVCAVEAALEAIRKRDPDVFDSFTKAQWELQPRRVQNHFQSLAQYEEGVYEEDPWYQHEAVSNADVRFGSLACICGAVEVNLAANGVDLGELVDVSPAVDGAALSAL